MQGLLGVLMMAVFSQLGSAGKIRLGFFVTSKEAAAYEKFSKHYSWDTLVNSLKTVTKDKLQTALSKKSSFPYDMEIEVTMVEVVDSKFSDPWIERTGKNYFTGVIDFCKYAKQRGSFDIGVLVFGTEEGKAYRPPFGFTMNSEACSERNMNCIHIYGQFQKLYRKEVLWYRLLAHEIGHQMGAKEGTRNKMDPCYDVMSGTPWRLKEPSLWKSCSKKRIEEVAGLGKLKCLKV
ncbi:uncharacterized protein LOC135499679 [Lineus longissimus]|uniref:uncharacterized protein LOC135499679 n=1 Tax=Lineus longissimus TaxID=88925 RepID=UPI002B4C2637